MGFLPVKAKMGGKGGGGLKLKTDMTGVSGSKANSPKASVKGKMYKNPGARKKA